MSSGYMPGAGYVLSYEEAAKVFKVPKIKTLNYIRMHRCYPIDVIPIILKSTGLIFRVEMMYRHEADIGRYDELGDGWFFIFDERLLYKKIETPIAKQLKKIKALPEYQIWTTYC